MDEFENESESVSDYLDRKIFPILLNAMEKMLMEAHRRDALEGKCFFNALDCLAEILWNRNSLHPSRSYTWTDVFSIPQFKLWLKSQPIYPKSWLWTKEEAALRIQRYIRGWLVRKRADVQEMRQFWKIISAERTELPIPESDLTFNKTVKSC